ncbi:MAG: restriction endonuclease subunit S [Treponemataceae bacterium]|nr:MAG: restriction endonuclease subunit S [Treponemataceae bacterium]
MNEWKETTLGEVLEFHRGYDLPKTSFTDGRIPVAGSNGIIGYHKESTTKGPGITIGRSGNIGTPKFYPTDFWAHNTVLFVSDFKGNDERFIFYLLHQFDFSTFNSGSAVPSLNRNYIYNISVNLPPLPIQRTIAATLSCLDDKIELNNRINANLEAQAQAIFKSWFVDFEPFQGGEFVDSALGKIPKGWRVGTLGDELSFINGFAFKSDTYAEKGTYKIITIKSVQDGSIDSAGADCISNLPENFNSQCQLEIGDVLLSLTGNVGRVGIVTEENLLLNQRVAKLNPRESELLPYFYFMFRRAEMKKYLEIIAKGTAQQNLSPVETLYAPLVFDRNTAIKYANTVSPICQAIITNRIQSRTLAAIRDILLSRLMSGEIEVPTEEEL